MVDTSSWHGRPDSKHDLDHTVSRPVRIASFPTTARITRLPVTADPNPTHTDCRFYMNRVVPQEEALDHEVLGHVAGPTSTPLPITSPRCRRPLLLSRRTAVSWQAPVRRRRYYGRRAERTVPVRCEGVRRRPPCVGLPRPPSPRCRTSRNPACGDAKIRRDAKSMQFNIVRILQN